MWIKPLNVTLTLRRTRTGWSLSVRINLRDLAKGHRSSRSGGHSTSIVIFMFEGKKVVFDRLPLFFLVSTVSEST